MNTVELHAAWSWCCDECGKDNFEYSVNLDLSKYGKEERRAIAISIRLIERDEETPESFEVLSQPEEVQCSHCAAMFAVMDPVADQA
jgi:hypothetical protein